ncbi:helix-turn-helix domain-containing protein [Rhizobium sp. YIM 134829]|uniref:helix-turn-helix domain-containing protein n=1 Tax=Rhizobium sp. YIM 134829 TaxID=3390453 RepID=UPI0039794A14
MLLIPLPFVIPILLFVFAARLQRGAAERGDEVIRFLVLLASYGVQSVLVGARWGYGLTALLPAMALNGTLVPPLAFLAFRGLVNGEARPSWGDLPHFLWPLAAAGLLLFWRDGVGLLIILDFLAYGIALVSLARGGPDRLATARLEGVGPSHRAMLITGWTLIASALCDFVINLDLSWTGGAYSGLVVATGTTISLILFASAAAFAQPGAPEHPEPSTVADIGDVRGGTDQDGLTATAEDAALAAEIDRLMEESALYRDLDLNLLRLARKLKRPARAVSQAINRVHGMSVSAYVNGLRVARAKALLKETDMAVTQVAFEAGFMTKSNFNREFLRLAGMSPSAWRQGKKA